MKASVVDDEAFGKGGIRNYIGICIIVAAFGVADAHVEGGMVGDLSFMCPEFIQLVLRFANRFFLPLWNRDNIDNVQVLERLGVLIKLVKDLKLQHQHKYDELQKTWLCKRCETMNAKLRVLEHILLLETYTQESIPALCKVRKYLVEATEEASLAYNKALIYEKLPKDISERHVLLLDPVLATGNSANQAIELLIQKGVPESHIIFLNLISVKNAMAELGRLLMYEASRDWLPTIRGEIQSPMGVASVEFIDPREPVAEVPHNTFVAS
ncbi:AUGMIN subunit 4 [Camellia lanceoleosa]|uniref:AUGMIN subunit 4 n=1 Tax=Camellia lanceoleosa TaxID=1840588 RepID=A0ACC0HSV7_9ERIC|nr:AUGMIN subunit 4 [Camellia lanceoleosa]